MIDTPHIYMLAAENGALPGGKAGGVADVVRELPRALRTLGRAVTVVCPAYGHLHRSEGMQHQSRLVVPFGGTTISLDCWQTTDEHGVRHVVLDHPAFAIDGGGIYHDDGPSRPFATDATRFALLSVAGAHWLNRFADEHALIHLHDWHTALIAPLRSQDPALARLASVRTVYTIHNLALQGIRPIDGDASSLRRWLPDSALDIDAIRDPRYPDCINPMLAGIRFSDATNTVSPTNAREIVEPDDPARGFRGGEGLHDVLRACAHDGRLFGILNGCDYDVSCERLTWREARDTMQHTLAYWQQADRVNAPLHALALRNIAAFTASAPSMLLTSVGRLTAQKLELVLQPADDGRSVLEHGIDTLGPDGMLALVGTGDPDIERQLVEIAQRDRRLVFLCGFSEPLADDLYRAGDLFLMPSSYEPCGISQMLAMRGGQPCLVHKVGGLNDTVSDGETGFVFAGDSPRRKATAFVRRLADAVEVFRGQPETWRRIARAASAARFEWSTTAEHYLESLYADAA